MSAKETGVDNQAKIVIEIVRIVQWKLSSRGGYTHKWQCLTFRPVALIFSANWSTATLLGAQTKTWWEIVKDTIGNMIKIKSLTLKTKSTCTPINLPDPGLAWPYDTRWQPRWQFSPYQADLELNWPASGEHFLQRKPTIQTCIIRHWWGDEVSISFPFFLFGGWSKWISGTTFTPIN